MTPEAENDNALLSGFLKKLLDPQPAGGVPKSRFADKFDERQADGVPVAHCRECGADVRAQARDPSKSWEGNTSTARWESSLDEHLAAHGA